LTGRLLLLVILAIVPALVIQAWNEYDQRIAREDDIRQHVVEITRQFGEEIGVLREGARQLLVALAQLDPVKFRQPEACDVLFANLKSRYPSYSLLGAADTAGQVFCASGPTALSSVLDQPFYTRAMGQPGLAVGNYWIDPDSGEKMIHFAERFESGEGHIAGVVFAGLNLAWLSDHLRERGLSPTASILIADREGNIIARLPHPELLVGKNMRASHERIMDGAEAGWEETVGVDGTPRIFGFVPPALRPKDFFLSAGQSKTEAFAAIDRGTLRGVGLILAGLFAAIYAAWVGGRKFIRRPIEGLLEVTSQWRNGNYDSRAHLADHSSEIGLLGSAFDQMADALAARHAAQRRAEEELRQLNVTLEARIRQRTIELESAIRAKSQFLANMSHEIRTPLNGVLGMLELVRQTDLGPTQQRFVDTARRSAGTLLGVINQILDLSKIEAGKVELEQSAFDLRAVVEEVTEAFADSAYNKGLELTCFVPANLPTALVGDPGRLRQILMNLIGNAVKFTESGEVSVRVRMVDEVGSSQVFSFEVIDTGIGISVEKQEHIFEAFAQADSSTTRRYGGTGLGLTIARHFSEMMGGSMSLASQPGLGSKFCFTARFGLTEELPEYIDARRNLVAGLAILVVTGSARNREILIDQLSARSVLVDLAPTAVEALAALRAKSSQYAWAIIDHSLTDLSGIELARAIKSVPANADLELILLAPFDQDIGKSANSSFKYITKPIRQSALWDILASGGAKAVARISNAARASVLQGSSAWGARVLLVEDSPVNLEVCVTILEGMGCVVETATNGLHAIDRYAGGQFDLIFMDCQMPEMDGYDATAEIRRREVISHRRTPIIALTGNVIEGARERCLAAGMDDYLPKPFTLDQIRAMLTVWLKSASPHPKAGLALLPASPPPAELVDFAVLDSLHYMQKDGRADVVERVLHLFFEAAADLLGDLQEGVASNDAARLHNASHALKSVSANVGAIALSSHCRDLEAMAQSGTVAEAAAVVREIIEDYRAAEILLSSRLPKVA
jgi:signal transduction histidine kinase/CheY-like chemotaxis protein/HPt (histidine-containing phosphotransfer) domain-containing protein